MEKSDLQPSVIAVLVLCVDFDGILLHFSVCISYVFACFCLSSATAFLSRIHLNAVLHVVVAAIIQVAFAEVVVTTAEV